MNMQRRTSDRPQGWLIECPVCEHTWKVGRDEIRTGRWHICPSCVDREHVPDDPNQREDGDAGHPSP